MSRAWGLCGVVWLIAGTASFAEPPPAAVKTLPVAGDAFLVQEHTAFVIMPRESVRETGLPWVWYAPTLPGLPGVEEKWMLQQFLDAGIAVAGIDVGESFGSPAGRELFTAFYTALVERRKFSRKPCLLGRSRGGLMIYNWAVEHPESVGGIAAIYPVCNLQSYPGIEKACGAYELTAQQLTDELAQHNPVSRVESLAKAKVPIFHLHGDRDAVVPIETNSGALAENYRKFGGTMMLSVVKNGGHDMWPGWFQSQELVDFVIRHAKESSSQRKEPPDGR